MNNDIGRLVTLLNLAERDRLVLRSPIRGHQLKTTVPNRIRYLFEWEEAALQTWCMVNDPDLWPMIQFSFLTGLRAREQWGLTWDKVKEEFLLVRRPKTSTRDHLPILPTVRSILERQRGKHPKFVWTSSQGFAVDHDNLSSRRFRKAADGAGLEDFKWHDFRHTFCSRLVSRGVGLYEVMALAGHSSIKTTQKYAHLAPGKLRSAMSVLEPQVTPKATPEKPNPRHT